MNPAAPTKNLPDPPLLRKLGAIELIYLAVIAVIAVFNLAAWFNLGMGRALAGHWSPINPQTAIAALLSALSLTLSLPRFSGLKVRAAQLFAFLAGLLAVTALLGYLHPAAARPGIFSGDHPGFPHR